jgi:hypothetical protein
MSGLSRLMNRRDPKAAPRPAVMLEVPLPAFVLSLRLVLKLLLGSHKKLLVFSLA